MERLTVELLRMFLRLRGGDFGPHTVAGNDDGGVGWWRGEGEVIIGSSAPPPSAAYTSRTNSTLWSAQGCCAMRVL